ncbi:YihY/virulence factor BrkB family protein [Boseongicola aestuarii]|uniref:Uncharacterized protein n=1 Tax=Boseongicola aestuarii TaxID=1470561 RepID=A0A238IWU3_9RHOB|nr:YihY/virulence factor BrkB family protein [Boseongicola aestuarii]SMX22452.1 hypothetical protein BOA8489_00548 [Boseongicola aestuarii]
MEETTPKPTQARPLLRGISLKQWGFILWRVLRRMGPDQLGVIAAGVAFYALLAVFPAIAALTALAGLFTEADAVVGQLQFFTQYLPEEAALILINQANTVASSSDEGLSLALALGVGFAIYLSTRATTSLIHGLNIAFKEQESRGIVAFWSTVILLTATLLFGVLILALLLIGLPTALAFVPLDVGTEQTLAAARWILVAAVVIAGMSILYRWGPSHGAARWKWLTPGTMISSALWYLGTIGFSIYVANFGNYNQTFGSLGGVIILLTWLWLSAFIILLGALLDAEVNAEIGL